MSGRAIILLSTDLLKDLLHMPSTAAVIDASFGDDGRHIELLVESPDLPSLDGRTITPTVTRVPESFEWSWGISRDQG